MSCRSAPHRLDKSYLKEIRNDSLSLRDKWAAKHCDQLPLLRLTFSLYSFKCVSEHTMKCEETSFCALIDWWILVNSWSSSLYSMFSLSLTPTHSILIKLSWVGGWPPPLMFTNEGHTQTDPPSRAFPPWMLCHHVKGYVIFTFIKSRRGHHILYISVTVHTEDIPVWQSCNPHLFSNHVMTFLWFLFFVKWIPASLFWATNWLKVLMLHSSACDCFVLRITLMTLFCICIWHKEVVYVKGWES